MIAVGLPTVLIGETAAGGGGGGGGAAGAGRAAGRAQLAAAELKAQVAVLVAAAKAGTPFCEVCFNKAVARFEDAAGV
jgi:hypothetical protein